MNGGLVQWKPMVGNTISSALRNKSKRNDSSSDGTISTISRANSKNNNSKKSSRKEQRQIPKDITVADYSNLSSPLPEPPSGMQWHRPEADPKSSTNNSGSGNAGREWSLITKDNNKQDQQKPNSHSTTQTIIRPRPARDICDKDEEWFILNRRSNSISSSCTTNSSHNNKAKSAYNDALPPTMTTSTTSFSKSSSRSSSFDESTSNSDTDKSCFSYTLLNNDHETYSSLSEDGILGVDYVEHIILPTDTLQGICIQYKLSATRLRQVNQFSGSTLLLAPKRLLVPLGRKLRSLKNSGSNHGNGGIDGTTAADNDDYGVFSGGDGTAVGVDSGIRMQDQSTVEYKTHKLMVECPGLGTVEAKAYLDLHDWELKEAIDAARDDLDWERTTTATNSTKSTHHLLSSSIYKEEESKLSSSMQERTNDVDDNNINIKLQFHHNIVERKKEDCSKDIAESLVGLKCLKEKAAKWEEVTVSDEHREELKISADIVNGIHQAVPLVLSRDKFSNKIVGIGNDVLSRGFREDPIMEFGIELKEMSHTSCLAKV